MAGGAGTSVPPSGGGGPPLEPEEVLDEEEDEDDELELDEPEEPVLPLDPVEVLVPPKLDEVLLSPSILHGEFTPDLSVTMFGRTYPLPFGISPVGMSGLFWPDAERLLAAAAARADIPYGLSTVAAQTPEAVAAHLGQHGWFQMYPPRDPEIRKDMLRRAQEAGFSALTRPSIRPSTPSWRARSWRST